MQIVSFIQRIPSIGGRYKAFSTCGSHLSVIFLNYETCVGIYLSSAATLSPPGRGKCDVHCDYSNDEPLHLQPKEQRHKGSLEEIHLQNVFFFMILSSTFGVGFQNESKGMKYWVCQNFSFFQNLILLVKFSSQVSLY